MGTLAAIIGGGIALGFGASQVAAGKPKAPVFTPPPSSASAQEGPAGQVAQNIADANRRQAAAGGSPRDTILTGPLGVTSGPTTGGKTLLGL